MHYIWEAFKEALQLIISFDPEVTRVVLTSLRFSLMSTLLASIIGVPLGILVSRVDFRGKGLLNVVLNTLLSLPTVVVGLIVYSLVSRRGLLGSWELLFTSWGVIVGQVLLILPILTTLVRNAIHDIDERMYETAISLGATRKQKFWLLLKEARYGIVGAIIAGFGRVIGEVGVSMMIGGNIRGRTRTITTAIALETSKGMFSFGLALGLILLIIAFLINFLIYHFQTGDRQ